MTIQQAIEYADEMKPNAFPANVKSQWLLDLEGKIALDVFLLSYKEVKALLEQYQNHPEAELLTTPPHDDLYPLWLMAKIDEANGEYNKYQNAMLTYNAHYGAFVRWFARVYKPAQGYRKEGAFYEAL